MPSWRQTIYILGLPRSGKSTTLNIIGSCKQVQSLEEPFDLLTIAQKGSRYATNSDVYKEYNDSYMSIMENYFSELMLGRIYNFRVNDKSCIYNIKSRDEVQRTHDLLRRSDVVKLSAEKRHTLAIAYNDVEDSIKFITLNAPKPKVIRVTRDIQKVAYEISNKKWFTDEQLEMQANLTPAYNKTIKWKNRKIYIPYLIENDDVDLFMSLDNPSRSLMYAFLQNLKLTRAINEIPEIVKNISLEDLLQRPLQEADKLFRALDLEPTNMTNNILNEIRSREYNPAADQKVEFCSRLEQYINTLT